MNTGSSRYAVLRRQIPFAVVTIVAVLAALTWAPQVFTDGALLVPLVLAFTATIVAAAVPWPKLPRMAAITVPLLNMLAIAFAQLAGLPASGLILLPVLVLARSGTIGMVLAVGGGVFVSWLPRLLEPEPLALTADSVVDFLLRPTVVVAVAVMLYLAERRSRARLRLLAAQSALVEELLKDTRADRELLETVLDTIQTKIVVLDGDGSIRQVNRATSQVYGGVIVPGRTVTDVAPALPSAKDTTADGDDGEAPEGSPLVRAARGEKFSNEVWWTRRPSGSRVAYRVSVAPLDGGSGGSVLAMEDLTRELEALARREEFVSAVSHELRTPLTSIVGYLDLVLDDPGLSEAGRRNLLIVERNARRLGILIENLLAAARGSEQAPAEPVDLVAVAKEVVENQTLRATEAQIRLRVAAPERRLIRGNRDRTTQVIDNLVSNAIKYSRAGDEVTVTVDEDNDGDGGPGAPGTARLVVQDHGPGIAAEEIPHVFERFYRAQSALQSTVQGTGLGLPITRQLVEDMGGRIALDSAVGQGTCVTVDLPAWRA